MILGRERILELIRNKEVIVDPFDENNVGAASIDLTLGNVFRTFKKSMKVVDIREDTDYKEITNLVTLNDGYMLLTPGELVHGITRERVKLPPYISGRIEGRSRFARLGLLVHISSGFVAPGSDGKIVLEIANLSPSPIAIYPGTRICQLILEEVNPPSEYKGRFKGQELP